MESLRTGSLLQQESMLNIVQQIDSFMLDKQHNI